MKQKKPPPRKSDRPSSGAWLHRDRRRVREQLSLWLGSYDQVCLRGAGKPQRPKVKRPKTPVYDQFG